MRQQRRAAKAMQNNAPLQLCFFHEDIYSQPIVDCIRTAPEYEGSLTAYGPKDPEKFKEYKECVLEEQAREQESRHTTHCHSFFGSGFGSTSCTSN